MKINLSFDTDDAKDRKLLRDLLDEICPGIVKGKYFNEHFRKEA